MVGDGLRFSGFEKTLNQIPIFCIILCNFFSRIVKKAGFFPMESWMRSPKNGFYHDFLMTTDSVPENEGDDLMVERLKADTHVIMEIPKYFHLIKNQYNLTDISYIIQGEVGY